MAEIAAEEAAKAADVSLSARKCARLTEVITELRQAEMVAARLRHEIETAFLMLDLDPDKQQVDLSTGIVSPRAAQNGQAAD